MNPGGWGAKVPSIGRLELETAKYAPFETKPEPLLMVPAVKEGESATISGIAVAGDRLAVALAGPDVVRFFDKKTAQPLGEVAVAKPAGLAVDAAGFIRVDAQLRSVSHPQVWAVGDCAAFAPALPKPRTPKPLAPLVSQMQPATDVALSPRTRGRRPGRKPPRLPPEPLRRPRSRRSAPGW